MQSLFSQLRLADVHEEVFRNIISIHSSQDLFDDLSDDPEEWVLAQQVEGEVKPPFYQSHQPIIHRPFEESHWFNVITWPFKHWQASRFSDGAFGVWYGCESVATSVYETAYHWFNRLLCDAGFENENVIGERKIYRVNCDAALLDVRPQIKSHRELLHKTDYSYAQAVGARLHREGHPGLITNSARSNEGHNFVILNPDVLSNPLYHCQLTYQLDGGHILVEKQPGETWLTIPSAVFAA